METGNSFRLDGLEKSKTTGIRSGTSAGAGDITANGALRRRRFIWRWQDLLSSA